MSIGLYEHFVNSNDTENTEPTQKIRLLPMKFDKNRILFCAVNECLSELKWLRAK